MLRRLLLPLAALAVVPVLASPASAHAHVEVGDYGLTVGFWSEPAFANLPNGPEVSVTEGAQEEPVVEGVELQVDVTFGGETTTLALEPGFSEPSAYSADFIPTRPGTYEFRIYGSIGDQEVDETIVSGPDTFSDVNDPAEVAFPEADPSNAELADRLEQETMRLAAQASEAEDAASSATTLAYIAIAVGAVALISGIALGMRGRGRA